MQYQKKRFSVPYIGKAYSENWERMFGKKEKEEPPMREWNGAKLSIRRTYHGCAEHRYHVELAGGEWPSDGDLITLCDGDTPPHSRHFGGTVRKNADGKSAEVSVFVD
jgi:hypothetical protein